MTCGVYVIKHLASGKVYVGSSVDAKRRLREHRARLNCHKHGNEYLQRAWDKYGRDGFSYEIVEWCESAERLVREQHWIDSLNASQEERGYNLIPTRQSQLYGKEIAKYQKAGWARLSKEERRAANAHLHDPETRKMAQARANLARATPEHSDMRRGIAARTITTDATRKKNSDRLKRLWQDPEWRAERLAGLDRGREKTNAARHAEAVARHASNEIV